MSAKDRPRHVSLPLLDPPGARRKPRSRMGWRRLAVLTGVHLVIAGHIVAWRMTGSTVSPVEPSESMETLELGALNAGFLFFVAAILSTLVLGRFLCGWGCHVVALQDGCAWLMQKLGVRPKPFRTRLLVWTPLILGLYMFVWPTLKRVAVVPALDLIDPSIADWLGRPTPFPPHGVEPHLIVEDFWSTFPGIAVAIPFLFICGFATVYFLGMKGFCTYGCPYGGIFGVADRAAPGRIVMDPARCDGNAHCTAVCTSNVRVHEEIRAHGMVVNPGCMKCMDCVSACPTDALSFKLRTPPGLGRGRRSTGPPAPPRKYDLTLRSELVLGGVMLAVFLSVRGAYGLIPMLMAIGIAPCAAFMAWTGWRLIREPSVRVPWLQLKYKGRLRPAGAVFAGVVVIGAGLAVHTGGVRLERFLGTRAAVGMFVPDGVFFRSERAPDDLRAIAARAAPHLARAAPIGAGGWGLLTDAEVVLRLIDARLLLGDRDDAEALLRRLIEAYGERDAWVARTAGLMITRGAGDEAAAWLTDVLERRPAFWTCAQTLADQRAAAEGPSAAVALADDCLARLEDRWTTREARSRLLMLRGRAVLWANGPAGEALSAFERAVELRPKSPEALELLSGATLQFSDDPERAVGLMERAVAADRQSLGRWLRLGRLYATVGRPDDARRAYERGEPYAAQFVKKRPTHAPHWLQLAQFRALAGDGAGALWALERGRARAGFTDAQAQAGWRVLMQAGAGVEAARWAAATGLDPRSGAPGGGA